MAKQYGSFMGGFSGKLGPAVGYMWNGRWVVRSLPTQVRNPRTEAQTACRALFKREVQLAASMRMAVLQGFTALAREAHMTSYNLFVSLNQDCFGLENGRFTVRWEGLRLSDGPVAPVLLGEPEYTSDNVLTVSFDKNLSAPRSRNYDRVYLYVYCESLGTGFLAAPVYRRDRRVSVMLPDCFAGCEVRLYAFVQDGQGHGSATCYGGSVVLSEIDESQTDVPIEADGFEEVSASAIPSGTLDAAAVSDSTVGRPLSQGLP